MKLQKTIRCPQPLQASKSNVVERAVFALLVVGLFFQISQLVGCRKKVVDLKTKVGAISHEESHQIMVNALDAIAERADDENIYVGSALNRKLAKQHGELAADSPLHLRWATTYAFGKAELRSGNFEKAFQLFEEAQELIQDKTDRIKPEIVNQFYFDTGMAFMRWGETQNCCKMNLPDSCIMPLSKATIHRDPVGSREAILWFTAVLDRTAPDADMHQAAKWLLNLCHMTLGEYPSGVASKHLISDLPTESTGPKSSIANHDFPVFENVAHKLGVATFSLAGGAIADDFDNDGNIDIVVSSFDPREPLRIFWNDGIGGFIADDSAVLAQMRGGLNLVQTDYNNDGLLDIFVLRGGWLGEGGKNANSLLHNNGDRTFVDVSVRAGLETGESYPTQTAAWADYDLDGDLDVYIGNEASRNFAAPGQLFENQGDGTFREVAKQMGVENNSLAKSVCWSDFDNDGDPDLFVSNYQAVNRLYRNDGTQFVDVADTMGVTKPIDSFPSWFCDVDNDGQLDLFASAYSGGIAELSLHLQKKPVNDVTFPRLYKGTEGAFRESAKTMGLGIATHPMGANFGDLDGDGYLDFYLGTGWPELHELMPNLLLCGGRDGFTDVTWPARVGHLQKGHAVAMADFDNDGDLDLFEQMGGFVPADKYYDVLYENPGTGRKYIKLKLIGSASNRAAIGAKIEIRYIESGETRLQFREVNSGGSFGANPLEQYFGLGHATAIESIRVTWPNGTTQVQEIVDAEINSRLVVTEVGKDR